MWIYLKRQTAQEVTLCTKVRILKINSRQTNYHMLWGLELIIKWKPVKNCQFFKWQYLWMFSLGVYQLIFLFKFFPWYYLPMQNIMHEQHKLKTTFMDQVFQGLVVRLPVFKEMNTLPNKDNNTFQCINISFHDSKTDMWIPNVAAIEYHNHNDTNKRYSFS